MAGGGGCKVMMGRVVPPLCLTMNEAAILESLSREASMRPFAPQFMGCVRGPSDD